MSVVSVYVVRHCRPRPREMLSKEVKKLGEKGKRENKK